MSVCDSDRPGRPDIVEPLAVASDHALVSSAQARYLPVPERALVHHPLLGRIPANAHAGVRASWRIDVPSRIDAAFPQLDVSCGHGWAVWPLWRLRLVDERVEHTPNDDGEPLAWRSSGLAVAELASPGIIVEHPPELTVARDIAADALRALTRSFGPLPWPRLHILIELQSADRGHEKGYALVYPSGMWCRAQLRPDAAGHGPKDRRRATELVVHELLHHALEFDTPAGHFLTEGLITYLARRLLVDAGLAGPTWLASLAAEARHDLRQWHLDDMSLQAASVRFFRSEAARRAAYRKGFLLARALDAELQGRLVDVCSALVRRARVAGFRLTEPHFLASIGGPARTIYRAAV